MDDDALQTFVSRSRLHLLEALVLKLHVLLPLLTNTVSSIELSRKLTEQALEKDASTLETVYLTDPFFSGLTDEQRVLLADEMREMVQSMKRHLKSVANLLEDSKRGSKKES